MAEISYETDQALSEYLLFHYGNAEDQLPWAFGPSEALDFPRRCAELVMEHTDSFHTALDLGCAVGRSSFELTRRFEQVIGMDFSNLFIQAAEAIRAGGIDYRCREEGLLCKNLRAEIPEGARPGAVEFVQGDASALPADFGAFDAVLMANLIDRLRHPSALLQRLPGLVRPGGIAVFTSPYTWMEEYTHFSEWIGGVEESTSESLPRILAPSFERIDRRDLPFLIREHARKYQWTVAEATVWRRI